MANVVARLSAGETSVEFSIEVGTFSSRSRQTSWQIDRPDPVDGFGIGVFRGKRYDQLRLSGVVFPGQLGTLDSVERLRALGDAGQPLLLTDGNGNVYGYWLVSQLEETASNFTGTGQPRRIEYSMTLEAQPDEGVV